MNKESKHSFRERYLILLRAQGEPDRIKKSQIICEKLFLTEEFKRAEIILFYASFDGEVETFEMMTQARKFGKRIALPTIIKDQKRIIPALVPNLESDLEEGFYGIKQPKTSCRGIALDNIDLVIVPGIAFDSENQRLGRGQGYYDRFLKEISSRLPAVGLAFDFQIVPHFPFTEEHDMKVSRVICN